MIVRSSGETQGQMSHEGCGFLADSMRGRARRGIRGGLSLRSVLSPDEFHAICQRPSGAADSAAPFPRLAPWAAFFRRFAAWGNAGAWRIRRLSNFRTHHIEALRGAGVLDAAHAADQIEGVAVEFAIF